MNGRERIHEFIREQERYATGSKLPRVGTRYWQLAAEMQLMLDVCNAAAKVVEHHLIVDVIPTGGLKAALNRLDNEAMRDQGVY